MRETRLRSQVGYHAATGKALVTASLPISDVEFLDLLSSQLAVPLGYRVSRATMFRFAVHQLREWVERVGAEEVERVYVDAVQGPRKVSGEPSGEAPDPTEAG